MAKKVTYTRKRVKGTKMGRKTKRELIPQKGPRDVLTVVEVQAMLSAAGSLRNRCLIAVLYETGVRNSEVAALKVGQVLPTDDHYRIWFDRVKGRTPKHWGYIVGSASKLREWLGKHPFARDPEAPLFPTIHGTPMHRTAIWHIVKMAGKRAGITKPVFPHTFRHTRATHLLQQNVTESKIKALLGWTQGSPMLGRYSHLASQDVEADILKLEGKEVPTAVVERVDFDAFMPSVEAMLRPPGYVGPLLPGLPPSLGSTTTMEELAQMVKAMAEQLRREEILRPAPSWASVDDYGRAMQEVLRLQEELRQELNHLRKG